MLTVDDADRERKRWIAEAVWCRERVQGEDTELELKRNSLLRIAAPQNMVPAVILHQCLILLRVPFKVFFEHFVDEYLLEPDRELPADYKGRFQVFPLGVPVLDLLWVVRLLIVRFDPQLVYVVVLRDALWSGR